MVGIWKRNKKGVNKTVVKNGDGNPVQDRGEECKMKVGRERDLEGTKMNRNENPIQDQPEWWRAGKDFEEEIGN